MVDREKSNFQGDKSSTIKPAQLVRGRFQRAKFNVGRTNCKKEVPVSEDISVPIVEEVKEMEISKKDDSYLISEVSYLLNLFELFQHCLTNIYLYHVLCFRFSILPDEEAGILKRQLLEF